jgi:large-conductance mechanosensitive channel
MALESARRSPYSGVPVDDTPKAFFEELRSSLLRKRVGQIALAVVLAEAAWRLVSSLTWYLIIPLIGRMLRGNTESVLLGRASTNPLPWENLFGSLLEFGLVVILVFYLNRWVQRKPTPAITEEVDLEYSSTGEALSIEEAGGENTLPIPEKHVQQGAAES